MKRTYSKGIKTLLVDTTTYCNLKCTMCPQSADNIEKSKGMMDFELLKKILDNVKRLDWDMSVLPFWNGEPLVYPHFAKMIYYAKEIGLVDGKKNLNLHTNAELLNEKNARAMIETQTFPQVLFSIDANTEETYNKIRQGGNFKRTIENIKRFIDIREDFLRNNPNSGWPKVALQIIAQEKNRNEIVDFVRYWSNYLASKDCKHQVNYWWDKPNAMAEDTIFVKRMFTSDLDHQKKMDQLHRKVVFLLGLITAKEYKSNEPIFRTDEYRT